jgi:CRP/FNR family transcriptional regulator, cyclic AMP receptor protein
LAWSALLDQSRLTATARAMEPTQLVQIDATQLLAICERDPRFACEIMRRAMLAMATRLSATRMQLLDVYGPHLPTAAQVAEETYGR